MDFRKSLKLRKIFSITGVSLIFLVFVFLNIYVIRLVLLITAFILMTLSVVITYLYFRCPQCAGALHSKYYSIPKFCPHCGKDLDSKS
jgi:hypothetical protein